MKAVLPDLLHVAIGEEEGGNNEQDEDNREHQRHPERPRRSHLGSQLFGRICTFAAVALVGEDTAGGMGIRTTPQVVK